MEPFRNFDIFRFLDTGMPFREHIGNNLNGRLLPKFQIFSNLRNFSLEVGAKPPLPLPLPL